MANVSTLLVALIAVAGSVVTTYLAQRSAAKNKRDDFDLARRQREEERAATHEKEWREQRRGCYLSLNVAIRQHRLAINDLLHGIRSGNVDGDLRLAVEDTRRTYMEHHAETQLTAPRDVLKAAGVVRGRLVDVYAIAKRLDGGQAGEGDTVEGALSRSEGCLRHIEHMRTLMRRDLGVDDEPEEGDEKVTQ
ncbi:hypothetical protein [Actinoallomurus sp. CA-142502]|uniref:hypothetical protein n=1 Tax=Actinoallomurus sp. CA-142502 TaxID=3239885 RepID=UPI003D8B63FD